MFSKESVKKIEEERKNWENNILNPATENGERKKQFESPSGIPLKPLYGPEDFQEPPHSREGYIPICIEGEFGRCDSMQGLLMQKKQMNDLNI